MMARRAQILQTSMAVRAKNVIVLDGVAAIRALAILHQLSLLQGDFKLLLITINLHQRRAKRRRRAPQAHADGAHGAREHVSAND